jgi:hypothetical protein
VQPIRRVIEGFLQGRYGYEGYRVFRVLAVPVLIGAIVVVGWLLVAPLLTIPRFTAEGPVVRNGVAVIVICGNNGTAMQRMKGLYEARDYVPEPRTGSWLDVQRGDCTVWHHRPPGPEQRFNRHERAH